MVLKELEYVLAIEKYGSISKAAEALFITQPALSRYISSLEDSLNLSLFERTGNRLTFTPEGRQYIGAAKRMMEIYGEFQEAVSSQSFTRRGKLRVSMPEFRACYFLPLVLPQFTREYPEVEVRILEAGAEKADELLLNKKADVAVMDYPPVHTNMTYYPFYEEEVLIAVPDSIKPIQPVKQKTWEPGKYPVASLQQFSGSPLLISKVFSRSGLFFDDVLEEELRVSRKIIYTQGILSGLNLCQAGVGICFLTDIFPKLYRKLEGVSYYALPGHPMWKERTYLAHRSNGQGSEGLPVYTRRFIELCLEADRKIRDCPGHIRDFV